MQKLHVIENVCIYGTIMSVGLVLFLTMHNARAYAAAAMAILLTGLGFFIISIARKDNGG